MLATFKGVEIDPFKPFDFEGFGESEESEESNMKQLVLIKAECGDRIDELFNKMVKHSQAIGCEVFGLFNGQLYVAYSWAKKADDVEKY